MKNIKLNKLAENRLQEKEMRSLIGGTGTKYEWNFACSKDDGLCCDIVCACNDFIMPGFPPRIANVVSATGVGSAMSLRDINQLA